MVFTAASTVPDTAAVKSVFDKWLRRPLGTNFSNHLFAHTVNLRLFKYQSNQISSFSDPVPSQPDYCSFFVLSKSFFVGFLVPLIIPLEPWLYLATLDSASFIKILPIHLQNSSPTLRQDLPKGIQTDFRLPWLLGCPAKEAFFSLLSLDLISLGLLAFLFLFLPSPVNFPSTFRIQSYCFMGGAWADFRKAGT